MTGLLFQKYVKHFDDRVGRPILLLVDNEPHAMGNYQP